MTWGVALLNALAGLLVAASSVTYWVGSGQGETLRGLDFADQLIRGAIVPDWGRYAGLAVYLLAALGAALIMVSPIRGALAAAVRLGVCGPVLTGCGIVVALGWFPIGNWGAAPFLCVVGLSLAVFVNAGQLIWYRRVTT